MVRWGFLGAGTIASHVLAPAVHAASGAVLHAAAARDEVRAAALRPAGPHYSSYDELINDPDVDAVYIALANDAHRRWTIAALDAGKHVLCEKPLGLSAADVDDMTATATRAGRLLVEALWYRWHPQTHRARELLGAGRIGTVQHVEAGFAFNGVAEGNYRLHPLRGGGALYDVGCYPISAALSAFGAAPVEVRADVSYGATGVDLAVDLVLTFDAGDARVHVGMDEPAREWFSVTGDGGVLEIVDRPFTAWFGADSEIRVGSDVVTVRATDPYRVMVEQVSAAIRGEPAYVFPLSETRRVAVVLDAAFESARRRGATTVVA